MMRQGVIGNRVSIFLPYDLEGKYGPIIRLDDVVTILEPKEQPSPETLIRDRVQGDRPIGCVIIYCHI